LESLEHSKEEGLISFEPKLLTLRPSLGLPSWFYHVFAVSNDLVYDPIFDVVSRMDSFSEKLFGEALSPHEIPNDLVCTVWKIQEHLEKSRG
jgi:hypothetical protein